MDSLPPSSRLIHAYAHFANAIFEFSAIANTYFWCAHAMHSDSENSPVMLVKFETKSNRVKGVAFHPKV